MLERHQRITRSSDFSRALREGARVRRADIAVHVLQMVAPPVDAAGPRFGLIVSKAVGDAVTRHTVARRLRVAASRCGLSPLDPTLVVIRALPGAAGRSSDALTAQLVSALLSVTAPRGAAGRARS